MTLEDRLRALTQRLGETIRGVPVPVEHGADPNVARPATARPVHWFGTVPPVNRIAGDQFIRAEAPWGTFVPPVGWYTPTPGYLGGGAGTTVAGTTYIMPFWVGPTPYEVDAFRWRVTTAASGGSGLVAEVGLYRDDGTGFPSVPDLVASGSSTDFSAGNRDVTFTPKTLAPGLYWTVWVFRQTSAPSTAPVFTCVANTSWGLPAPGTVQVGVGIRSLVLSRASLPSSPADLTRNNVSVSGGTAAPVILLRRSA